MTPEDLARLIRGYRYRHASEKDLQDGLARVFDGAGLSYARECPLAPGDVIDFLVQGGIGVEVKVGAGLSDATRQLHRYAAHEAVASLLLVTSRCRLDRMPAELRGKPVGVVVIPGAFL